MAITRNRGSKRLRSRAGNGRFRRATVANTFGLRVPVCPHCRGCNPVAVGEEPPEACKQCGETVAAEAWV